MYHHHTQHLPKPPYQRPLLSPDLRQLSDDETTVVWIGHSTVFINLCGVHILTDPVFSEQVGVPLIRDLWKIGPRRYTAPAVALEDLPPIDVILLSHAHLDHLDLWSLRKLASRETEVVTAVGTAGLLRGFHYGAVHELGGEGQLKLKLNHHITLRPLPVRHWGRRYPWNKSYGWTGFLIEAAGRKLVFAGDTAYTPRFRELASEHAIDLVMMPIGAYSPDSYQRSHCTPEQAWEMFKDTGGSFLLPIHHKTFVLSEEPVDEPLMRLLATAREEQNRVVVRQQGESFQLP